ncbi:hypothetical protein [Caulobacter sp. DWR3-1-2]|uniref:hypothetical protein n=1 Tax=Caulobacter sp. DWR3-1-2 TaxID=2804647 RepID=UPI003CF4DA53
MEQSKKRATLVACVAVAGTMTAAAIAALAWPALTRPEPPTEAAAGADGISIHLVQPPKAAVARTGLLDVGLSDAALAMTKGRQALTDTFAPAADSPPPRPVMGPAPPRVIPVERDDEEVGLPQTEPDRRDDRWERERWARDDAREAQRARWERERMAEDDRRERAALEQERLEQRRWRDDREDDRYAPPPRGDDPPPGEPW